MKFIKQAIKIEINFALSRIRYNLLNKLSHQHYINRYKSVIHNHKLSIISMKPLLILVGNTR